MNKAMFAVVADMALALLVLLCVALTIVCFCIVGGLWFLKNILWRSRWRYLRCCCCVVVGARAGLRLLVIVCVCGGGSLFDLQLVFD